MISTDLTLDRSNESRELVVSSSLSFYGVDWSDQVQPNDHCWFPLTSVSRVQCVYEFCEHSRSTIDLTFIECGSCGLIIHEDHLINRKQIIRLDKSIPCCRPSFVDEDQSEMDDHLHYDQHYWSIVSSLKHRCVVCQRKKIAKRRLQQDATSSNNVIDSKRKKFDQCLLCQWCSRGCHQQCFNEIRAEKDNLQRCDYGKFRDIIVRPYWLHRTKEKEPQFYAEYGRNVDESRLSSCTPVIVFINKLSGGQEGSSLYRQLVRILNPRQVFLIENSEGIHRALDLYSVLENVRICICGGDGTVAWILSILADRSISLTNPPAAICPLGTGNDLSRVLNWGWSYKKNGIVDILQRISCAEEMPLDRWRISIEEIDLNQFENHLENYRRRFSCLLEDPQFVVETDPPSYENDRTPRNKHFTNYLSVGLDGAVVLDFHDRRVRNPSAFTSPLKNKFIYLNTSRKYWKEFVLWPSWDLASYITLFCDGQDRSESIRCCHTIVLLNIESYGSGTKPWGHPSAIHRTTREKSSNISPRRERNDSHENVSTQFEEQRCDDHKIEVFGLNSVEMALIHIGFRGRRIAQCHEVKMVFSRPMPVHMDGEPFYLDKSTSLTVNHHGQVLVLRKGKKSTRQ